MSTQPAAIRIDTDGTVTVLADASYQTLSDGVGGLIEAAPTDERVVVWVNEEGKVNDLDFNPLGHALWMMVDEYGCTTAGDWMAGPCVVTGPYDDEGETTPVPDWVLPSLQRLTEAICRGVVAVLAEGRSDG